MTEKRRSSKRRSSRRPVRPNFDVGPSGRTFEEKATAGEGTRERPLGTGTSERPQTLTTVPVVAELLASPGYYQTTSRSVMYLVAKMLSWHPLVKLGQDLPFVEGNILFFQVVPALVRNAADWQAFGYAPDHWKNILLRYPNWELGWWREVVQNARDARDAQHPNGPTKIDLSVTEGVYTDPKTGDRRAAMVVSASDNGSGMSREVLTGAFLSYSGSSKKESTTSVGGFGDAKNLILFPHLGWVVETQDVRVVGQHAEFLPLETVPYRDGTKITVWMPLDTTTTEEHARQLLGRCYLPNVDLTVNGLRVAADLITGDVRAQSTVTDYRREVGGKPNSNFGKEVGTISIRYVEASEAGMLAGGSEVLVRGRGVYLFSLEATDVDGVVYVDVDAPPRLVFDANRISLIGQAKSFVEAERKKLIKEPGAYTRSKKHFVDKIYRGAGDISAREGEAAEAAAEAMRKNQEEWARHILRQDEARRKKLSKTERDAEDRLKKETEERMAEQARQACEEQERLSKERRARQSREMTEDERLAMEAAEAARSSRDTEARIARASAAAAVTPEQMASAIRYAAWQPDFRLTSNVPFWKAPEYVEPEMMADEYAVLLGVWTGICKYMLNLAAPRFAAFNVGFVFILEQGGVALGSYKHDWPSQDNGWNESHWLSINPLRFREGSVSERDRMEWEAYAKSQRAAWETQGLSVWTEDGPAFDLDLTKDRRRLASIAIHEVTHMQGFSEHDVNFISQLHKNEDVIQGGEFESFMDDLIRSVVKDVKNRKVTIKRERAEEKKRAKDLASGRSPWDVILGRVAVLLERYAEWDRLSDSAIKDLAEKSPNDPDALRSEAEYLRDRSDIRSFVSTPEAILKLHDAAVAAGGFKIAPTDTEARDALNAMRKPLPADPRAPASRRSSKPKTPKDTVLPSNYAVFSWHRAGNEWVLREGYLGQRGQEIWRYTGDMSYPDRRRQRPNGEFWEKLIAERNKTGRPVPPLDDTYVWFAISNVSWGLGLDNAYQASEFPSNTAYVMGTGDVFTVGGIPIDAETFDTAAEAQKYVMDEVVRQRAGL